MTALAPTAHSGIVGGSTAAKRLACPASWQMEQKVPASARAESSAYADEGTALHDAMAYMLDNDILDASEVEGMVFGANVEGRASCQITPELVRDCLAPALAVFDDIAEHEGDDFQFLIERRCELLGIPGAFGTSDLIARGKDCSYILDWKFGAGVTVLADYDGVPNAQLMFYAMAALHTYPAMFGDRIGNIGDQPDWPVVLWIVQPRSRDEDSRVTSVTVTVRDLFEFRDALVRAVVEAQSAEPRMEKGDHCRFAACKTICPLHTGPLLDLGRFSGGALAEVKNDPETDWAGLYAHLLTIADAVEPLIKEIQSQAHAWLEDGNAIPGYKLVPKRAGARSWIDADKAEKYLARQGVALEDRRVVETVTPAVAEKLLKALGKELKPSYVAPGTSSGTKIARADDARQEVVPIAATMRLLGDKLAGIAPAGN